MTCLDRILDVQELDCCAIIFPVWHFEVEPTEGSILKLVIIIDLKAQIAANQKGINLVKALIEEYTLEVVQAYMLHIRRNAEMAVRTLLKQVVQKQQGKDLTAIDYMDDGTPICLKISIDEATGNAVFDFDGTGPEVYGNTNTPESVCHSAIIYCVRCLVAEDIPLNSGCLEPIDIRIPEKSILRPSETSAVVGGNVLTSQRIVDVVLRAFEACAASQGDCNNLTFGKNDVSKGSANGWGYYETIAGGMKYICCLSTLGSKRLSFLFAILRTRRRSRLAWPRWRTHGMNIY